MIYKCQTQVKLCSEYLWIWFPPGLESLLSIRTKTGDSHISDERRGGFRPSHKKVICEVLYILLRGKNGLSEE